MRHRTGAAVLVTAALALAPLATAAGVGPVGPYPMTIDPLWVLRGTQTVEVTLDVDVWDTYTVEVTVDGTTAKHTIEPDEGRLVGDVQLPDDLDCGPALVEATVRWGEYGKLIYERDHEGRFYVLCPRLAVDPDRVPGPATQQELAWELTGFVPSSVAALRLGDEPVQVVRTDQDGAARFSGPADLDCGAVLARAVDATSPAVRRRWEIPADLVVGASDGIEVDCPEDPPTEPTEPAVPASVQVNPVVVPTGTTTRVSGQRFAAGATVTLSWLLPGGRTLPAGTAVADATGSFSTDVLVLVNSGIGPRELVAGAAPAAASDQALVVAGTTQPGRHGLVSRR